MKDFIRGFKIIIDPKNLGELAGFIFLGLLVAALFLFIISIILTVFK